MRGSAVFSGDQRVEVSINDPAAFLSIDSLGADYGRGVPQFGHVPVIQRRETTAAAPAAGPISGPIRPETESPAD